MSGTNDDSKKKPAEDARQLTDEELKEVAGGTVKRSPLVKKPSRKVGDSDILGTWSGGTGGGGSIKGTDKLKS